MPRINAPYHLTKFRRLLPTINCSTTHINFHKSRLQSDDFEELRAYLEKHAQIEGLNLSQMKLGHPQRFNAFLKLLKSKAMHAIRQLNLSNNELQGYQWEHVLEALVQSAPHLTSLNLNACQLLYCDWGKIIVILKKIPSLKTLKIKDNNLSGVEGWTLRIALKQMNQITRVEIEKNNFPQVLIDGITEQLQENTLYYQLHEAVMRNSYWDVLINLIQKAPVNVKDRRGNNVIVYAINNGDLLILRLLIQWGASLINLNPNGESALHVALQLGKTDIISWLLENQPQLLAEKNIQGLTPQDLAEQIDNTPNHEFIKLIRSSIVHHYLEAAERGDSICVTAMLTLGVIPKVKYKQSRQTALHLATKGEHLSIVQALIPKFSELLSMKDAQDKSALELAEENPSNPCIKYLRRQMLVALQLAIIAETVDQVELLMKAGVNLNWIDIKDEAHPLWLAARTANLKLIEILQKSTGENFIVAHGLELLKIIPQQPNVLSHYIEKLLHQHDRKIIVSNFDVVYSGEKAHKHVTLPLNDIHEQLSKRIITGIDTNIDTEDTTLNLVAAKISFIVSDRSHVKGQPHGRKVISLDVNLPKKFQHVEDYYPIVRQGNGPKSEELKAVIVKTSPQKSHSVINERFATSRFHREYHHSERALYGYLSQADTLNRLGNQLLEHCQSSPNVKVYSVVLHLHSTHTVCIPCEESLPYQYGPQSQWLRQLVQKLKENGFKVLTKEDTLAVAVTVSADKQAIKSEPSSQSIHASLSSNTKSLNVNSQLKSRGTLIISQLPGLMAQMEYGLFSNYSTRKLKHDLKITNSVLTLR